jgi:RNA polymerase sigma-70 factor, ECF subfamily
MAGHPTDMRQAQSAARAENPAFEPPIAPASESTPTFSELYEEYFDFVWRSARRLGVAESSLDDVVQDVFVTVYRRLSSFEGRSQIKTWIFGILRHTVRDLRRTQRRKPTESLDHEPADLRSGGPQDAFAKEQGTRLLHAVLLELNEELREVFVLSELEQMSAPEVGASLSLNVNTVYSRLRTARKEFDAALRRLRCRDEWRTR